MKVNLTQLADILEASGILWRLLSRSQLLAELRPRAVLQLARQVRRGLRGHLTLLRLHALAAPERLALCAEGIRLTYGELDARICRLAHGLRRLGVAPGDAVGLLLDNGHEFIEISAALGLLGATTVQIGYRLKPREVAYILSHAGVRALLYHAGHAEVATEALSLAQADGLPPPIRIVAGAGRGAVPYEELVSSGPTDDPPYAPGGSQGSLLLYTSGTTGRSKGARRDMASTSLTTVMAMLAELPLFRDDRHLVCCPLYHAAAPAFCACVMAVGGSLVIPRHFDATKVPALIEQERITSSVMVPTMLGRLMQLGDELRRHDLSSLRWLMSVAAPLPSELARQVEERLGPILYNMYGATETGIVTLARPGEHTARPGTIGRRVFGNDIRLLDEQGREVPVGQVGELYVKNGTLVSGYFRDPEATRQAMRDGYFSVGDLAYRDADGYYYLADRKSDMVISGGVNIYPLEIEQRLHSHPAVVDSAVIGVPDADWGESLWAYVVLRPGWEPGPELAAELCQFVSQELADYKRPRRVLFVDSIPRGPTGKIDKHMLRREARLLLQAMPTAHA
ncbi:MAG: AMP-binding protein [Myxococcota bacterium]|nr:AMP-binding protein [Myxococcota bacterium]